MSKYYFKISLILFFAGVILFSCAAPTRQIMRYSLEPASSGELSQEHNNLVVEIKPLSHEEVFKNPRLAVKVNGKKYDSIFGWLNQEFQICAIPVPAFEVKVTNNTGHVVRTAGAVIRLADNTGNLYKPFSSKEELSAYLENEQQRLLQTGKYRVDYSSVKMRLMTLPILGNNIEFLPGYTETYFLTFNTPVTSGLMKYQQFMDSISSFTLKLFDFVTKTDAAGNPTERTNFEFRLLKKAFQYTYKGGKLIYSKPL